jgi:hypothetical protein
LFIFPSLVFGLNTCNTGFRINSGQTVKINCHGICKNIKNNNGVSVFVSTKDINQWNGFVNNQKGIVKTE